MKIRTRHLMLAALAATLFGGVAWYFFPRTTVLSTLPSQTPKAHTWPPDHLDDFVPVGERLVQDARLDFDGDGQMEIAMVTAPAEYANGAVRYHLLTYGFSNRLGRWVKEYDDMFDAYDTETSYAPLFNVSVTDLNHDGHAELLVAYVHMLPVRSIDWFLLARNKAGTMQRHQRAVEDLQAYGFMGRNGFISLGDQHDFGPGTGLIEETFRQHLAKDSFDEDTGPHWNAYFTFDDTGVRLFKAISSDVIAKTNRTRIEDSYLEAPFRVLRVLKNPKAPQFVVITTERRSADCGTSAAEPSCLDDTACRGACYFFVEPDYANGSEPHGRLAATALGVAGLDYDTPITFVDADNLQFLTSYGDPTSHDDGVVGVEELWNVNLRDGNAEVIRRQSAGD